MNFLTDENVPTSVVIALKKSGYNVKDVKENNLCGTSDTALMKIAYDENRIIITHDKDFGNILQLSKHLHKGVILLRFRDQRPNQIVTTLLQVLALNIKKKFENNITIISEARVTIHKQ